jgi:hypothetical protein
MEIIIIGRLIQVLDALGIAVRKEKAKQKQPQKDFNAVCKTSSPKALATSCRRSHNFLIFAFTNVDYGVFQYSQEGFTGIMGLLK